jgi:hypothetical protein
VSQPYDEQLEATPSTDAEPTLDTQPADAPTGAPIDVP